LDNIVHACAHRSLFCREIFGCSTNDWAHFVDIASVFFLLVFSYTAPSVHPGSTEAELLREHFFKASSSPRPTDESMLHTYWTSVCKCLSAEKTYSTQMKEASNDQNHADGIVKRRGIDAFQEAIGDDIS
jgi:hypothetical protein